MRKIAALLLILILFCIPSLYRELSQGIRLDKLIQLAPPSVSITSSDNGPTFQVREILGQDFDYLGQGTQSYVFASRDGNYVLKLFRFEEASNPVYRFYRTRLKGKPLRLSYEKKIERIVNACTIAQENAVEETALVALHLYQSQELWPSVRLHGPLGKSWSVPLDKFSFAIQLRGERIYPSLLTTLDLENESHAKAKLDSLYALLKRRSGKKIVNLDNNLHRNFGFIGDRAFEMDFGAYAIDPNIREKEEIRHFSHILENWLAKRSPKWFSYWKQIQDDDN